MAVTDITSDQHFQALLKSTKLVVVVFMTNTSAPWLEMAPVFEDLASSLSRPNQVAFARVNTSVVSSVGGLKLATATLPTFLLYRTGRVIDEVKGADKVRLQTLVARLVAEADRAASGAGPAEPWFGAGLPRGYSDITGQVEQKRLDLLNYDSSVGAVRVLFSMDEPGRGGEAGAGAGSSSTAAGAADWIESDTDEQLMLYIPFQSMVKLHTIQITSRPSGDDVARPAVVRLYSNSPHNLGFDEAEDTQATQEVELKASDWNDKDTASISLRFVKFQNINSVVLFVVSAEGGVEKTRVDRIRLIGEAGEKREMGKLEKIGDELGE